MRIEDIPPGILKAVRKHLAAKYPDTIGVDHIITRMDAKMLMVNWAGRHLKSEKWGADIINSYEKLKKLEGENDKQ